MRATAARSTCALGDHPRRAEQILRAIAERTGAQFRLGRAAPAPPASGRRKARARPIPRRAPKRRRSVCEICAMCATCFIDEVMNVARHSHAGCRTIRMPRQKSRAAAIAGSAGKVAQISASG